MPNRTPAHGGRLRGHYHSRLPVHLHAHAHAHGCACVHSAGALATSLPPALPTAGPRLSCVVIQSNWQQAAQMTSNSSWPGCCRGLCHCMLLCGLDDVCCHGEGCSCEMMGLRGRGIEVPRAPQRQALTNAGNEGPRCCAQCSTLVSASQITALAVPWDRLHWDRGVSRENAHMPLGSSRGN